jgi:dTDP-4-amino-4,6-dideoxygalactose transaminase/CelD/BcsL family acetyltransferase involved in cellulose biosynthesis
MTVPRLSIWPTLSPQVYLRQPADTLAYPLEDPNCRLFALGRHAILHGVRALGLARGDEVLVPAYHHGSEVQALAEAGLACRFYDCDERLEPVEGRLADLLGPRTRALHLTHFLGFPQDAIRWRQWCDEHELLLIEDAAQAWLSSRDGIPVGSVGDLAVFCLYKTIGVPEGAALISTTPPEAPPLDPRRGVVAVARRHGAWLAERSALFNALARPLSRPKELPPEQEWGLGDVNAGAWRAVPWLLPRLGDAGVASGRRANFVLLLDAIGPRVPSPFAELPTGACPFVFPIETDDKDRLLERLAAHGVRGIDLWSLPHPSLPTTGFPDAEARRRRTVGLPVHQELRIKQLERIIDAVEEAPRRAPPLRLEPLAGFDAADEEWQVLAVRADNIFATKEWLSTWWRHFGHGELRIFGVRRADGSLAAIVPLYRARVGPARTLRFVGHGPSDQNGPICHPAERVAVARALRSALREGVFGDWDILLAEQLLGSDGWSALLDGTVVRRESSPVVRGDRSFDELLASRSGHFRRQVRRQERKLLRERELSYRLSNDPERLRDDLTVLFDLHAARWSEDESDAFTPERQAFHREFASLAMERGWLRLWIAETAERPSAALHGFRFAGSEVHYQGGRDPAWDRYSVGSVLLSHAIREALDDGVTEYRLLRGDEPYKRRFADDDPGLETFVVTRGAISRTAVALGSQLAQRDGPRRLFRRMVM